MNQFSKVGVSFIALAAMTVTAFAADLTGTWKGKIHIETTKLSHAPTAAKHSAMLNKIPHIHQMTFSLTLKANHTFSETAPGAPSRTGTWTLSGTTLALQTMAGGKAQGKADLFMSQPDPVAKTKDAIRVTYTR